MYIPNFTAPELVAYAAIIGGISAIASLGFARLARANLDSGPSDPQPEPEELPPAAEIHVTTSGTYPKTLTHSDLVREAHDANGRAAFLAGIADLACLQLERKGLIAEAADIRARVKAACERKTAGQAS